jgi:hypothetical protein
MAILHRLVLYYLVQLVAFSSSGIEHPKLLELQLQLQLSIKACASDFSFFNTAFFS